MNLYAELATRTAFSFQQGASLPEELVAQAAALGHAAIGIADCNSVAGLVRALEAAEQVGLRLLAGARLVFADGTPDLLCYPMNRAGWGRLTRLLSVGRARGAAVPGRPCVLEAADLAEAAADQLLIALPEPEAADLPARLAWLGRLAPGRAFLATRRRFGAGDAVELERMAALAAASGLRLLAVNDVLYHVPERRRLHDVLSCIRLRCTLDEAGTRLAPHAERHLKPAAEMARLFRGHEAAIEAIGEVLARARFSLRELAYCYPAEFVPAGMTADAHLAARARAGAAARYPAGVPGKVAAMLARELAMVAQLNYAAYFLTVHDMVRFARDQGILCQGRGSAANSALCYCLGVTAVDPMQSDLLFERFISPERQEPPDIDIDFEHERREEVIQYIYRRYGRHRAALAATVIHYRARLAIREVGKVMGLGADAIAALAAQTWARGDEPWQDAHVREAGLDPESPTLRQVIALARELIGLPRHLSQHVGGFVLTEDRLDETVPVVPAAMAGRTCIEWDKDDIDCLRMMKVDVLALGMLSCLARGFALLRGQGVDVTSLADVPGEDGAVYAMLCRGDSLGVFQVESRAQMNMLPRLQPREFYDLVIEVAIVRPGPIQGDMVHPYLRRRQELEPVRFASPAPEHGPPDELARILGRTLGVPLFQEQAMRIAMEAAKFSPGEVNALRRAMATFRNVGTIHTFQRAMVERMVGRGYDRAFAERCFEQIKGFGTYGFPESHAASFAILVYISAWMKCHHPACFACALLNSQPMGFYAPAQIVRDASAHGVRVLPADVSASDWDCTIEEGALRLGLRMIGGFREAWAARLMADRPGDFASLVRLGLPRAALLALAEADALRGLDLDRRAALWRVGGLTDLTELPLFAGLEPVAARVALPPTPDAERMMDDYRTTGLSLRGHPMRHLRSGFLADGVVTCVQAGQAADGTRLRVAGIVLVRQRPGSAGGVVFATIEDETGIANIVIWASLIERFRAAILGAALLEVTGRVQRSAEGIVHVVAETLADRGALLRGLVDQPARAGLPAPRDFR